MLNRDMLHPSPEGLRPGPKGSRGFTLIEIVVAFTLLALLMTGLYRIMAAGYSVWNNSQREIDSQQNLRVAAENIVRELRTAHTWDIGAPGPSLIPDSSITMRIPKPVSGQETEVSYTTIRYYLTGENLLRDINGAGHNVVAYGIKGVKFEEDTGSNTISLVIRGEKGIWFATKAFVRVNKGYLFSQ